MGTAVATTNPKAPVGNNITDARNFLSQCQSEIEKMASRELRPEVLISAALNSCRKNPKLLTCSRISFLSALLQCAETNLVPDTPLQECHLVPFWSGKRQCNEVTWIPGYRGLTKLATRSGEVSKIDAQPVRENDLFDYMYGTEPFLKHKPSERLSEAGETTHFYAIAYYVNIAIPPLFLVMTKEEVEGLRARSKQKDGDPWVKDFDQMGCKTTVRRLCDKRLVLSSERLARAVSLDYGADTGDQEIHPSLQGIVELDEEALKTATEKLSEKVGGKQEQPKKPEKEDPTKTPSLKEVTDTIMALEGSKKFDLKIPELREQQLGYVDISAAEPDKVLDYKTFLEALPDKEKSVA